MMRPDGLYDRLKDRDRHVRAGLAATERAPPAIGVVVADPDRHGHIICEADEPGIVLVICRASLACDIGSERTHSARSAPLNDPLQHCFQLIEGSPIGGAGSLQGG